MTLQTNFKLWEILIWKLIMFLFITHFPHYVNILWVTSNAKNIYMKLPMRYPGSRDWQTSHCNIVPIVVSHLKCDYWGISRKYSSCDNNSTTSVAQWYALWALHEVVRYPVGLWPGNKCSYLAHDYDE